MVTPLLRDDLQATIGPRFIKRLNYNAGTARVKGGLDIASLRAAGGPPGINARSQPQAGPGLLDLPTSGTGMLSSLAAQTDPVSPLAVGLGQEEDSTALRLLQAGALNLRRHLQQSSNQSRLLQATSSPRRTQGGFGLQFSAARIDLLG